MSAVNLIVKVDMCAIGCTTKKMLDGDMVGCNYCVTVLVRFFPPSYLDGMVFHPFKDINFLAPFVLNFLKGVIMMKKVEEALLLVQ